MKTKKKIETRKPYSKWLMLGVTAREMAESICDLKEEYTEDLDLSAQNFDADWVENLIKMLVESKDKNIKFVVDDEGEESTVFAPKLDDLDGLFYDSDSWYGAEDDANKLNQFILDFYGTENPIHKAKVTKAQYVKKKSCPVCKSKKEIRMDGRLHTVNGNEVRSVLGCDKCNAQWEEVFKLTGFDNLHSR